MNLRVDRSQVFDLFAVENEGVLSDLRLVDKSETDPRYRLYLARVKKILPAVNGAILDLGDRQAYLGWQDLDPKRKEKGMKITDGLKLEERLLVQIRREESGDKADKATLRIAIPGAYGVYLPREPGLSISSKIRDPKIREVLKSSVTSLESEGAILRTLSAEVAPGLVKDELAGLRAAFQKIEEKASRSKSLGAFDLDLDPEAVFFAAWLKGARVLISNDADDQALAQAWSLEFVLDPSPLDMVWADFSGLRDRKVPLKGMEANILEEELETLTAIDVNRGGGAKASVARVDQAAMAEAMRQVRLRNIGGMVVMDIIDKRNAPRTTRVATKEKKKDSHPNRIYGPTAMGLIEWARTKRGASLLQMTGDREHPTSAYALWRLDLALRKVARSSAACIQGSPALIAELKASDQWRAWEIPAKWKRVEWEVLAQTGEMLRVLPRLR